MAWWTLYNIRKRSMYNIKKLKLGIWEKLVLKKEGKNILYKSCIFLALSYFIN